MESEKYDTIGNDFTDEFTDEGDDWGMYFEVDNTNKVNNMEYNE